MRNKLLYISAFVLICNTIVWSQSKDLNEFTGIKQKGSIPECFTKLSTQKFKDAKATLNRKESHFEKKSKKEFFLKSNFMIDEVLLSGKVLYGDPVSEYLNEIADYLLKDDKKLRDKVQFFTNKSHYTNAFATNQGIIFVNTGLIARANSEAELAFILGHELTHITEDHIISMHVERDRMIKNKGEYRGISINDNLLNFNSMSKENEFEADKGSYENFYSQSEYCLDELSDIFNTLLYAQKPFTEKEFEPSFFETEYYKFPANYTVHDESKDSGDEENEYDKKDSDDEELSTHPAPMERKKTLNRLKVKESNEGREKYIISKERFEYIRALCQFESIKQLMIEQHHVDAMYNCYSLLEEYPHNKFLETTLASALYIYSRFRTEDRSFYKNEYFISQSTEADKFYDFIWNVDDEELTLLAIKYLEEVRERHGHNAFFDNMMKELLHDLFFTHEIAKRELFTESEIIALNKTSDTTEQDLYYLNALAFPLENEAFNSEVTEISDKKKEYDRTKEEFERKSRKAQRKIKKEKRKVANKEKRDEKLHGKSLGIEKVVVVHPFYFKLKEKSKDPIQLIESEKKQLRLSNRIKNCAAESELDVKIINPKEFSSANSDDFIHMSILSDWFDERLEYDKDIHITPYCSAFIGNTIDHYNTKHILWTGVLSEKRKKDVWTPIIGSIVYTAGLTLPLVVTWACIPSYNTAYFSLVFDVESGKNELSIGKVMRISDASGDFVNSLTYDTFYQLNNKSSK